MIIYFLAPYLSVFFQLDQLEIVLKILGLNIFFYNFSAIQIVLISRALKFRKIFLANVFAVVISSAIAIIMANLGYGIWSLVCQQIAYQIVSTFGLFIDRKSVV